MDYWINSNEIQKGPYSLEQLKLMWREGQFTTDTYYYDELRSEWLTLQGLVESIHGLFTPEEAFVRLGQNRQSGCLTVYNQAEALHLFVDGGFVVCAMGDKEQGEFVLSRALGLVDAAYEWFLDAKPPAVNLRLNIPEYALKHSIARDVRIGNKATRRHNTVALPKVGPDKAAAKLNFTYVLVPEEAPADVIRLVKLTSVVGREAYCDLVVHDSQVSRKHCLLEAGAENVKVKDLESSNGTFVNGVPVWNGVLNVEDKLGLGQYNLVLRKEQKKAPDPG